MHSVTVPLESLRWKWTAIGNCIQRTQESLDFEGIASGGCGWESDRCSEVQVEEFELSIH